MHGIYSEAENKQTVPACVTKKLYLASDSLAVFRLPFLVPLPRGDIFIRVCYSVPLWNGAESCSAKVNNTSGFTVPDACNAKGWCMVQLPSFAAGVPLDICGLLKR